MSGKFERTHLPDGVIVGQFWKNKVFGETREINNIGDGWISLDTGGKMIARRRIPTLQFMAEWFCVRPVELKPYVKNHGQIAWQIIKLDSNGRRYSVIGEIRNDRPKNN